MGAPDLIVPGTASGTAPVGGTGTTNYLAKWTGGSTLGNSIVFDDGSKVGIGTASPDARLHVDVVSTNAMVEALRVSNANGGSLVGAEIGFRTGASNIQRAYVSNGFGATDYYLALGTTVGGVKTETMRLTGGNVGIGTASPLAKLHTLINGTGVVSAGSDPAPGTLFEGTNTALTTGSTSTQQLAIMSNSAVAADAGGGLVLGGKYTGNAYANFGAIKSGKDNATGAQYGGYLAFYTRTDGQAGVGERMRIDSSGRVAIGTTSATAGRALTTVADLDVFGVRVGRGPGDIASNTAIGAGALSLCSTGSENTAIGQNAGFGISTGVRNVMIGTATGSGSTVTGSRNIVIGRQAGNQLTSGSDNVLVGTQAGDSITTGSSNIVIGCGAGADVAAAGDSNQLVLGDATNYVATNGGATTYYATAGASLGYMRVRLNGTYVKIEVFADV